MFKVQKANLQSSGGTLETTSVKDAGLTGMTVDYSKSGKGLNFFDDEGLFAHVRFSKAVAADLAAEKYTVAQLLKYGEISRWEDNDGNERYTFVTPVDARRGKSTITVQDLVKKAKPISKTVTSSQLEKLLIA